VSCLPSTERLGPATPWRFSIPDRIGAQPRRPGSVPPFTDRASGSAASRLLAHSSAHSRDLAYVEIAGSGVASWHSGFHELTATDLHMPMHVQILDSGGRAGAPWAAR